MCTKRRSSRVASSYQRERCRSLGSPNRENTRRFSPFFRFLLLPPAFSRVSPARRETPVISLCRRCLRCRLMAYGPRVFVVPRRRLIAPSACALFTTDMESYSYMESIARALAFRFRETGSRIFRVCHPCGGTGVDLVAQRRATSPKILPRKTLSSTIARKKVFRWCN